MSSDHDALEAFTCARLGEPWTEAIQHAIRQDLADQLASGDASALGLIDSHGTLCGVAAWRIHRTTKPPLCRADIVAIVVSRQRNGYGRTLKRALISAATEAGAVAVSSIVHRENAAMIHPEQAPRRRHRAHRRRSPPRSLCDRAVVSASVSG